MTLRTGTYLRDKSEAFISSSSLERLAPVREDRLRNNNTIPWRKKAHHNERQPWESFVFICSLTSVYFALVQVAELRRKCAK